MDIRTLAGYQAAKDAGRSVVTEPTINPDTGFPVIFVRYPIIAMASSSAAPRANITLDILSRFLASHRTSAHSMTIIADPTDGKIISYPDRKKAFETGERPAGSGEAGQHCR